MPSPSIIRTVKIDTAIIHHSVTPQAWGKDQTMQNLNASPMAYDGKAPYHRIGGGSWEAQGRPDNTVGYHSGSTKVTNNQSIAICLMGNFQVDTPTEFQKQWLARTLKDVMQKYGIKRERIFLHKEVRDNATACPGNFVTQQFLDTLLAMPTTDKLSDHIVDGMPADQRIAALKEQVGRYKDEIRKRDEIINHPDEGIGALKAKIEELKKQIEQGGDNAEAAEKLAKAKAAYKALGDALA